MQRWRWLPSLVTYLFRSEALERMCVVRVNSLWHACRLSPVAWTCRACCHPFSLGFDCLSSAAKLHEHTRISHLHCSIKVFHLCLLLFIFMYMYACDAYRALAILINFYYICNLLLAVTTSSSSLKCPLPIYQCTHTFVPPPFAGVRPII